MMQDGPLTTKYAVRRSDGNDGPGMKHDGCAYFVLDLTHDRHAKAALLAYADACEHTHPTLAARLRAHAPDAGRGSASDAVSLTISPAIAEHIDGPTVVMVVEAGPGCDGGYQCPAERHSLGCYAGSANDPDDWERNKPQPPAELVALRDARCGRCGGMEGYSVGGKPCPDCHNGRKLVEVRVPHDGCEDCADSGLIAGWLYGEVKPGCWSHVPCVCNPKATNHRTLHGLIDVAPVRSGPGIHPVPCLVLYEDGVGLWLSKADTPIVLDPTHVAALEAQLGRPIEPGMFAVVFQAVEQ